MRSYTHLCLYSCLGLADRHSERELGEVSHVNRRHGAQYVVECVIYRVNPEFQ